MTACTELNEMTFSERFRELKDKSGLTIQQIADKSGLDYEIISSYLLGRRNPSAVNLFKLAKAFDVSCEYFMTCDESQTGQKPKKKRK